MNGIPSKKVDELLEKFEEDGVTRKNLENWEQDERRRLGVSGARGVSTKNIERHMHMEYIMPDKTEILFGRRLEVCERRLKCLRSCSGFAPSRSRRCL